MAAFNVVVALALFTLAIASTGTSAQTPSAFPGGSRCAAIWTSKNFTSVGLRSCPNPFQLWHLHIGAALHHTADAAYNRNFSMYYDCYENAEVAPCIAAGCSWCPSTPPTNSPPVANGLPNGYCLPLGMDGLYGTCDIIDQFFTPMLNERFTEAIPFPSASSQKNCMALSADSTVCGTTQGCQWCNLTTVDGKYGLQWNATTPLDGICQVATLAGSPGDLCADLTVALPEGAYDFSGAFSAGGLTAASLAAAAVSALFFLSAA